MTKTGKAEAVVSQFAEHPGRNADGVLTIRTRHGVEVTIGRVEHGELDGVPHVDVYAAGETAGGDPHFRIINPPLLVEDPNGDVTLTDTLPGGKETTRRFREDPLAAIAEVMAGHGGGRR